ncbi:MAG: hypothetical protein DI570_03575 [Phenylobacterium zucineum]|nr:MAG: hypothetical protein DI570_03575 [Phenylobacterium zucineum]
MPCSAPGGLLHSGLLLSVLADAGVDRASIVRVTGPCALPALLWLCRHGFDQVGHLRGDGCPHEDAPDALIAAHACDELGLKRLAPLARLVRPGGVLMVQVRQDAFDGPAAVDWLLRTAGFAAERRLAGGRRALLVARRSAPGLRAAA